MASTTSNLGLIKPASGEGYSLDVWNTNMQKIDDAYHLNVYANTTTPSSSLCPNDYDSTKNPLVFIAKREGICFVSFRGIGRTHVEDETLIASLPEGYRPVSAVHFTVALGSDGVCVGYINSQGKATIWSLNTTLGAQVTRAVFNVSFPCS